MKKQHYKAIIIIFILSLIDQISKFIIIAKRDLLPIGNNILQINYQENYGIAFGIIMGGRISYIIANFMIIILVSKFLFTQLNRINKIKRLSLILIIAGGIGNLVDRIVRGYVVDFIDFSKIIDFPIFNFADIMIVIGVVCLGIISFIEISNENIKYYKTKK